MLIRHHWQAKILSLKMPQADLKVFGDAPHPDFRRMPHKMLRPKQDFHEQKKSPKSNQPP